MISTVSGSAWMTIGRLVGDHLWQSTLFAAVAGLLTLAFRNNRAQVRNGLWLAASVKFLVPFTALVAIGNHFGWHRTALPFQGSAPIVIGIDTVSQPFAHLASGAPPSVTSHTLAAVLPIVLFGIWLCGLVVILLTWWRGWWRVAAIVRAAPPVSRGPELNALRRLEAVAGIAKPVVLVSPETSLEPGVFGIANPVLLWPRNLAGRLSLVHIEMILAHELSHVRRRDNLAAAIHMLVEAIFWFHPLVWWLGARIVDERERACDEDVLRMGSEPQAYAESVLKVCEFYLESPRVFVSGVTGSNLKMRMERIMSKQVGETLNRWRKLFLATAAIATLVVPVIMGTFAVTHVMAQSPSETNWQTAAGGKMAFDVVSVKRDTTVPSPSTMNSNMPLGPGDFMRPAGGRFSVTNYPLRQIISFAYKQTGRSTQYLIAGLPGWVNSDRFDIEARAGSPNPTKDQFRLMVQSLLTDRFKMTTHYEVRQLPAIALVQVRPGKLGPQIAPHTDDATCTTMAQFQQAQGSTQRASTQGPGDALPPLPCGATSDLGASNPGRFRVGGRKVPLSLLLTEFSVYDAFDRPMIDQTGLMGTFDYWLEFGIQPNNGPTPPDFQVDSTAPTFQEALQDQLGLKLERKTGPVDVIVVDHIEEPSPN